MSEFKIEVVCVGPVVKHPNADTLSIADVGGYPCIIRTGEFQEGDKAVYLPIDSIVPNEPRWAFLDGRLRIKAKKLRGVFSMGLLTAADPSWVLGQDVQAEMGVTKYDPEAQAENAPTRVPGGDDDKDPGGCPVYDIEGYRRHKTLFVPGEPVWVSEKLHGQSAKFMHDGDRLHVASHYRFKKLDSPVTWADVARRYDLAAKLAPYPHIALYGETYGNVGDMRYGVVRPEGDRLALFDALDTKARRWFDVDEFLAFAAGLDLPVVPTLYRGPWDPSLTALAEGKTTMPGADHVREGIVIKPLIERTAHMGRVFLKLAGEGYLLRKGA